jgi:hypothetical protein
VPPLRIQASAFAAPRSHSPSAAPVQRDFYLKLVESRKVYEKELAKAKKRLVYSGSTELIFIPSLFLCTNSLGGV